MALASQMARTNAAGRVSAGGFRRRRLLAGKRVLGIALLVVVLGGGGYMLVRSRDGASAPTTRGDGGGLGPASAAAATSSRGDDRRTTPGIVPPLPSPMTRSQPAPLRPVQGTDLEMTSSRGGTTVATPASAGSLGASTQHGAPVRDPLASPLPSSTPTSAQTDPASRDAISSGGNPIATPPAGDGAGALPSGTASNELASGGVRPWMAEAERLQSTGKLVQARTVLNAALHDPSTREGDKAALRRWLGELNESVLFSPTVYAGDPLTESYTVSKGDSLPVITRKLSLHPEFMFIARVNRMSNPSRLSVGQKLKVVRGPFHAIVDKSDFRLDIYAGDPPPASASGGAGSSGLTNPVEPGWTFIRSFTVGLGEGDSTPVGAFVVRNGSKLVNPFWRNPRTGEAFEPDNPKNPIGERWVGLEGLDPASAGHTGYGIHGTVDPESIGRQMSMGCVRLGSEDVELVYDLLTPRVSVVRIVP